MAKQKQIAGLALRLAAAQSLQTVLKGASFSPLSSSLVPDPRDRALANKLVSTALRYHGPITNLIGELLERGLPRKSGLFEPVLRLSLAQLLFLPDLGAHSALFLAGEAMRADPRSQHLIKLMNGVLREAQRRPLPDLSPATLLPPALRQSWEAAYGAPAVTRFSEALLAGAPLDLTVKAPIAELGGEAVLADTVRLASRDSAIEDLPGYREGQFWVQDAAAAIPARLMHLPAGARVLDLCAAPGGKTAQLVKAGYQVTALDRDAERMLRLRTNLERLGYGAELVTADALAYTAPAPFDGVLVDAPCSATGIFRRHPEVIWHRRPDDIAGRVAVQRQMIAAGSASLRPGGVLVYCVCSLEPEEGEAQAEWAAGQGLDRLPVDAAELAGWSAPLTARGEVRTHPALPLGSAPGGTLDGFFVARFLKR